MSQPQNQTQQSEQHPGGWGAMLDQVIRQTESMAPEAHATLLDKVIAQCPAGRGKGLNSLLEKMEDRLRSILPQQYKPEAERYIKTAILTISRKGGDLLECTPNSIVYAVFEAAKYGFAIDGRLFHIVSRNKNFGTYDKPRWGKEAQCMPDWKGLVAVAKRAGLIKHADAEIVKAGDEFEHAKLDGGNHLRHTWKLGAERGEVRGAYARVWLPCGLWDYELMDLKDLQHVAAKSSSFNPNKGKPSGPWVTDPEEMQKKTVMRRILKPLQDDPIMGAVLAMEDRDYQPDNPDGNIPSGAPVKPDTNSPLDQLAAILPPAPGEQLASFSEGTEPAPETTEAAPAAAGEPDEDRDGLTLDALDCELSSASESWEVDDTAARFAKSFHTPAGQARAAQMIETKRQSMPRSVHDKKKAAPPAGKQKQKNLMDTHSNTGK